MDPEGCATLWVSVLILVVQGELGHLVCQLIGSHLQVVELGVCFGHDKVLLFWLVAIAVGMETHAYPLPHVKRSTGLCREPSPSGSLL